MTTARAWQAEVLPKIDAAIAAGQRPVVIAATGTGKTYVCAMVAAAHKPCIVVVPTENLVRQTVKGFAAFGVAAGAFYGRKKEPDAEVVVCCRPSLSGLATRRAGPVGVILDEAHQDPESLREALGQLDVAWLIGLSATPWKSKATETLRLHDSVIEGCSLARALDDGILTPWRWIRRKKGSEIQDDSGTEAIDLAVIEDILEHAPAGPGIVTAATISDAHAFAARLTAAGVPASAISGKDSPKAQDALIERLRVGELAYLVQVKLLGEGVDLPFLRVVVFRDDLSSPVRFVQIAGRGMRTYPGKDMLTLIDPRSYSVRIGLAHDARVGAMELEEALVRALAAPAEAPKPVVLSGPVALSETSSWLASIWDAYQRAGYPVPRQTPWRPGYPTKAEISALVRKSATRSKVLPAPIREPFRQIVEAAPYLSAADVGIAFAILWSTGEWYDAIRGEARWAKFVHRKQLLDALPGDPPEGVLAGLRSLTAPQLEQAIPWPWEVEINHEV
jgi:hypothetical protein